MFTEIMQGEIEAQKFIGFNRLFHFHLESSIAFDAFGIPKLE